MGDLGRAGVVVAPSDDDKRRSPVIEVINHTPLLRQLRLLV